MKGQMTLRSRYAIEAGDLAILSNEWTFTAGELTMGATTAEVAQRQADDGRLYVIDHPFAGLDLRNWPRWARRWRAEFEGVPSCAISAGPG